MRIAIGHRGEPGKTGRAFVSRLLVLLLTVGGLSILSAGTAHAAVTGGDVRVVDGYVVHVFEESGQLAVPAGFEGFTVEFLAIAGGGGGGGSNTSDRAAGGGGAGGATEGTFVLEAGETYPVTIGAGGDGGEPGEPGHDGDETAIGSVITVPGGGGGGGYGASGTIRNGRDGGSGGGAAAGASGGSAVSGGSYGHDGGSLSHTTSAAGGGGAGAPGPDDGSYGAGGAGWSSTLAASYGVDAAGVAGGGSGGGWSFGGAASHGGGKGGSSSAMPGGDATSYGSGGGGAGTTSGAVDAPGGDGHAGVVAIRYPLENLPKLVNTAKPQISGDAVDGAALTVSDGAWDGTVAATAYQWERCDTGGNNCQTLDGAASSTYALNLDDIGHRLRATVTATPELGVDVDATSDPTDVVAAKDVVASMPTISGVPQHGQILTASPGAWSGSGGIMFTYQWHRLSGSTGLSIPGATGATYVLGLDDIGHHIRVEVTGTPTAGDPVPMPSAVTDQIQPLPLTTGTPTMSGTARHGQTLTVDVDEAGWHGSGDVTFDIEWQRCDADDCVPIGAGPTHVAAFADIGNTIRAAVTGQARHGDPDTVMTAPTGPVEPKIVTSVVPEVFGAAVEGGIVHVTEPDVGWEGSGELTFTHRWLRCDIAGDSCTQVASGSSYSIHLADIGHTIRFEITGTPEAGDPVTERSLPSAVVTPADLTAATPTVSGIARHGETLAADPNADDWSGSGEITFTFQWERQSGPAWQPITGAVDATYVPGLNDIGHDLRVTVTGTPEAGDPVTVASAAIGDVEPLPTTSGAPVLSGTPRHGQTLTVDIDQANWRGSGEFVFDLQWLRCDSAGDDCVPIGIDDPATGYELTTDDIGHTITVEVTGKPTHGAAATTTADPAEPVEPRHIVAGAVTISGPAQVTETLTAHVDVATWDSSSPLTFTVVWWRCLSDGCVQIGDGDAHLLTVDDLAATLHVDVTGTDAWGNARTISSAENGPIVGVDEPEVTVSDADTPIAEHITVTGALFLPHSRAQVWLHSDPTLLGEVTVSADGTFTGTFALPRGVSGEHTVVVVGYGSDGQPRTLTSPVTITESGSGAPSAPGSQRLPAESIPLERSSDDLAFTGAPTTTVVWVGLVALLLGAALIRRRQRS